MSGPSPTCGGTGDMLPAERACASFDSAKLRSMISTSDRKEQAKQFEHLFEGEPFNGVEMDVFRSYEDLFRQKVLRVTEAIRIVRNNPEFRKAHTSYRVGMAEMYQDTYGGSQLGIHFSMFLTFLETQSDAEQRKAWLPKAYRAEYFGAYSQTELGHGSNIRALETTATYDKATGEFEIHSPTLTSLKWWPSGMVMCTHGVVMARLIIDGRNYGFHGFMVQFRDDRGRLMPGVEVGEIGPKLNGMNPNIAYARFTHVRIPRFNMFAKNQQVLADGTYVPAPPKLSRFKYISMMIIRKEFVNMSAAWLGQAATIVIRYSCVRRQGFKDSTVEDPVPLGENVVMDYRMQQYRAFRALGLSYMFRWNAKYVDRYLRRIQQDVMEGNDRAAKAADEMPELHATLAGFKVLSTVWAHQFIEDCRRACGGQGFLIASGIADLSRSFGVASTGEGDAVILHMQVARFLIKAAEAARSGRSGDLVGSVTYLADAPLGQLTVGSFARQTDVLLAMLKDRAARVARGLEARFERARARGRGFDDALNSTALEAYHAADAHTIYVMARNQATVLADVADPAIKAVLMRLHEFTMLQVIAESAGDWIGILDEARVDLIKDRIEELLEELRPDAVALTDAFGYSDEELHHSTLGRFDGNVYEAIYAAARKSPLNQSDTMIGWEGPDGFGSVLDLDFLREGMKTQRVGPPVDAVLPDATSVIAPVAAGAQRAKL